jgi:hypothetical protein
MNIKQPSRGPLPSYVLVVNISNGVDHSVAVSSSGKVYAWGNNSFGQCGESDISSSASSLSSSSTTTNTLSAVDGRIIQPGLLIPSGGENEPISSSSFIQSASTSSSNVQLLPSNEGTSSSSDPLSLSNSRPFSIKVSSVSRSSNHATPEAPIRVTLPSSLSDNTNRNSQTAIAYAFATGKSTFLIRRPQPISTSSIRSGATHALFVAPGGNVLVLVHEGSKIELHNNKEGREEGEGRRGPHSFSKHSSRGGLQSPHQSLPMLPFSTPGTFPTTASVYPSMVATPIVLRRKGANRGNSSAFNAIALPEIPLWRLIVKQNAKEIVSSANPSSSSLSSMSLLSSLASSSTLSHSRRRLFYDPLHAVVWASRSSSPASSSSIENFAKFERFEAISSSSLSPPKDLYSQFDAIQGKKTSSLEYSNERSSVSSSSLEGNGRKNDFSLTSSSSMSLFAVPSGAEFLADPRFSLPLVADNISSAAATTSSLYSNNVNEKESVLSSSSSSASSSEAEASKVGVIMMALIGSMLDRHEEGDSDTAISSSSSKRKTAQLNVTKTSSSSTSSSSSLTKTAASFNVSPLDNSRLRASAFEMVPLETCVRFPPPGSPGGAEPSQNWSMGGSDNISFMPSEDVYLCALGSYGCSEAYKATATISQGTDATSGAKLSEVEIVFPTKASTAEIAVFDLPEPILLEAGTRYHWSQKHKDASGLRGWNSDTSTSSPYKAPHSLCTFTFSDSTQSGNNGSSAGRGLMPSLYFKLASDVLKAENNLKKDAISRDVGGKVLELGGLNAALALARGSDTSQSAVGIKSSIPPLIPSLLVNVTSSSDFTNLLSIASWALELLQRCVPSDPEIVVTPRLLPSLSASTASIAAARYSLSTCLRLFGVNLQLLEKVTSSTSTVKIREKEEEGVESISSPPGGGGGPRITSTSLLPSDAEIKQEAKKLLLSSSSSPTSSSSSSSTTASAVITGGEARKRQDQVDDSFSSSLSYQKFDNNAVDEEGASAARACNGISPPAWIPSDPVDLCTILWDVHRLLEDSAKFAYSVADAALAAQVSKAYSQCFHALHPTWELKLQRLGTLTRSVELEQRAITLRTKKGASQQAISINSNTVKKMDKNEAQNSEQNAVNNYGSFEFAELATCLNLFLAFYVSFSCFHERVITDRLLKLLLFLRIV